MDYKLEMNFKISENAKLWIKFKSKNKLSKMMDYKLEFQLIEMNITIFLTIDMCDK